MSAQPGIDATASRVTWGACALLLGAAASAQEGSVALPGDADGELAASLTQALDGRDRIDGRWSGEARVAEWTSALEELLGAPARAGPEDGGDSDDAVVEFLDLRVPDWTTVFSDGGLAVSRRASAAPDEARVVALSRAEIHKALEAYAMGGDTRVALKIVGIETGPEHPWTDVRATAFEVHADRRVEHTALWRVGWSAGTESPARMVRFHWIDEHRATLPGSAPAFLDCTTFAFAAPLDEGCVLGLDAWRRRLDSLLGTGLLGHQGFAFADVNADGWDDLYLCQPGGLPNRLFLSAGSEVLSDASQGCGADFLDRSSSALLLHLDGDDTVDLALATPGEILFMAGDGGGRFELRRRMPASTTTSLAAADFDLDGDLDIYVCGYVSPYNDSATPVPYHDANNGERNLLLRNDGGFEFVDATRDAGLDQNNRRFSFAAAWQDHDQDGDPDLYVANDFGRNNLYRNDGGKFVDVAAELGVEDISAGMGVAWGDVDNDGWDDLYVSNMFSAAGNRIAYEAAFQPDASAAERSALRRHARGNTLFRNVEGGSFEDVTASAAVGMGRWAWGSILFDANSDGRLDILVPNGMLTGQRDDDL